MQRGLITEKEHTAAESSIKNIRDMAEKEEVSVEGIILEGRPCEAIIDEANEKKTDLIVLGSHGRTGLERLLMGSVTERVIGLSACAVLVVRAR